MGWKVRVLEFGSWQGLGICLLTTMSRSAPMYASSPLLKFHHSIAKHKVSLIPYTVWIIILLNLTAVWWILILFL